MVVLDGLYDGYLWNWQQFLLGCDVIRRTGVIDIGASYIDSAKSRDARRKVIVLADTKWSYGP